VLVSNTDGALLPGMTANSTIQVAHVDNATIVPLAALSYQPPSGAFAGRRTHRATATAGAPTATSAAAPNASPWGATTTTTSGAVTPGVTGRIFVLRSGKLTPVAVNVGLVTDTQASVTPVRGTLAAGAQVVTGDTGGARATHAAAGGNPLTGSKSGSTRGMLGGVR
jgi:hypothetical protein